MWYYILPLFTYTENTVWLMLCNTKGANTPFTTNFQTACMHNSHHSTLIFWFGFRLRGRRRGRGWASATSWHLQKYICWRNPYILLAIMTGNQCQGVTHSLIAENNKTKWYMLCNKALFLQEMLVKFQCFVSYLPLGYQADPTKRVPRKTKFHLIVQSI